MSVLLLEGRKENLKKKYSDKFKEYPDTLDFVLNIDTLSKSNHKYTDFFLKSLHPNSSMDEIDESVELIKNFERLSKNLEIKDINQYNSFEQLESAIKEVEKTKPLSEKIYEDDAFLVLIPKNEEASCKYGSNTKWCVTSRGSGHFDRYTSGAQQLYFIINKKYSTHNNYSKVAVHVGYDGDFSYWDAQDNRMGDREINVLEYAFPEMIDAIKNDFISKSNIKQKRFLYSIFNQDIGDEYAIDKNYLNSGLSLRVVVDGFENVGGFDDNRAMAEAIIKLESSDKSQTLDAYDILISYGFDEEKTIHVTFYFDGSEMDEEETIDLGMDGHVNNVDFTSISDTPMKTSRRIGQYLSLYILNKIKKNPKLIERVKGDGPFWLPNRRYGYLFKENKGLIKKLVDYLDSGNVNGTKIDFLEYIGKIEKRMKDGKPEYTISGTGVWRPNLKGYFSSFFGSAKSAGIIEYQREGNKYNIKPGPNFDAFKKGELKSL